MRHWNCGNIGHGSGQSVSNVNFWITLKYFMSPPLICMESEFTRAFDQSLVVISSRWRRWRSDQQAAAVPPRLYSVLCTLYSAAVLLYCSPPHRLPRSDPVPARQPERHDLKWPNAITPSPVTLTLSLVTTLTPVEGGRVKTSGSGQFYWVFLSWTLFFR